jgi:hypothetical protein
MFCCRLLHLKQGLNKLLETGSTGKTGKGEIQMATKNPIILKLEEVESKIITVKPCCNEIKAKLAEIEGESGLLRFAELKLTDLRSEKKDVLSDISLGRDRQSDLDRINSETIKTQTEADNFKLSISGLRQKLQASENELENLNYHRIQLKEEFIRDEAEKAQAEYLCHAKLLLDKFKQLQSLAFIHKGLQSGKPPFDFGGEHQHLSIPLFKLESAEQHPNNTYGSWPKWIPAAAVSNASGPDKDQITIEKNRLARLGIDL